MENLAAAKLQYQIENAGVSQIFKYDENLTDGIVKTVRIAKDDKKKEELEKFNVDFDSMMLGVLTNEAAVGLSRFLLKNITDAEETKNFNHKFVIASGKVISCLQDSENFKHEPLVNSNNAGLQIVGKINETALIVYPYISYSQTHCLAFDDEYPISYNIEENNTEEHYGIEIRIKALDNLKCYVWNCPENILDKF